LKCGTKTDLGNVVMPPASFPPDIQSNELWRGRVTAGRHMSVEWYLFGGCNVLVVTTF
jgi:hypothetical protein